jgi:hypothetical protein
MWQHGKGGSFTSESKENCLVGLEEGTSLILRQAQDDGLEERRRRRLDPGPRKLTFYAAVEAAESFAAGFFR